ncbi:MAG: hypothetical protein PHI58_03285 [Candidatus Omnitrophica bacterium]|nr:hypothetical protein [Candidatus Omnitrophota bacterium]
MHIFRIIVSVSAVSIFLVSSAVCAENAAVKPADTGAAKAKKEVTEAGLIVRIKGNLDRLPEVVNLIQDLKQAKDASGNIVYTYKGKKIEDLPKEQLANLYARINVEATRIRTERINAQLESIRRAGDATRQARQVVMPPAQPQLPPAQPAVPQPPKTPPAPPPAPPRR